MLLNKKKEKLQDNFKKLSNKLSERCNEMVGSDESNVKEMIDFLIIDSGKKLRPMLVMLFAFNEKQINSLYNGFFSLDGLDKIIDLALAIELLHIATLIHDDVIDNSTLRRNRETYNIKFGINKSILFGDYLFSKSFELVAKLKNHRINEVLSKTVGYICEGEILEVSLLNNLDIDVEAYYKIIRLKTATLISTSCLVGALLNCKVEYEEELVSFGLNMGMAFQIYDDYLDFAGQSKTLGKPVYNDINNGVFTLPIICLLNQIHKNEREEFFNQLKEDNYSALPELLDKHNCMEYTLKQAENYIELARSYLRKLSDKNLVSVLNEILNRITHRES